MTLRKRQHEGDLAKAVEHERNAVRLAEQDLIKLPTYTDAFREVLRL